MKNCFTDSLLYKENGKVVEKLLPDDIDSGDEADPKSGEDLEVSFDEEPIVTYLNDPDCNNSADNGDERFLNENVNFNYPSCCDDVNSPIDKSPLHMHLPMSMPCIHIEKMMGLYL